MTKELATLGEALTSRWAGALYSLSPADARHFCTSAREVIISMLDRAALDATVMEKVPNCEKTDRNMPTRRAKLTYLLNRHGVRTQELADAVNADVDNVLSLFRTFNDGTHGHAGRFTITELTAIRTRHPQRAMGPSAMGAAKILLMATSRNQGAAQALMLVQLANLRSRSTTCIRRPGTSVRRSRSTPS